MKRLKKKTWKLKRSSVFVPSRHIASIEFVFVQKKYTVMRSKRTLMEGFTIVIFWFSLFTILITSSAIDTITATQSIRDGETIVSAGGSFELGFFSPGNSKNRYVGIWYKISTTTVVWVANRESPLLESSGVLKVTNQGILTILNGNGSIIWSSNSTRAAQNPVAVLLNSGNLVVRDGNDNNRENFLWQSFDYPCDTLLPGMKLGRDLETGIDRYISSWKSNNDPSRGDFTFRLDPRGFPQLVLMKETVEQFRSGPWNGLRFSGLPNLKPNQFYKFNLIFSDHEIYYIYEPLTSTVVTRLVLNQTGKVQRFIWIHQTNGWSLYLTLLPLDDCDDYAFCGAHGSCNIGNSPECGCLKGFEPKFQKRWDAAYWSNGCVRRTSLDCQKGDGFLKYSGIKLPDVRNSSFDRSMNLEECRMVCLKNCSCMAYSNLDISEGGRGCLLWFGDLIDIRESNQNGQDIYIRMASSEIALQLGKVGSDRKKQKRYIAASVILTVMLLLGLGLTLYLLKKNKLKRQAKLEHGPERSDSTECKKEDLELPLFDYATIADATDNFSVSNKLGEGGFGPVYKGMLNDGQEIAVKRLSKNSTQGIDEFKNEVLCIAKLQHRNLVKLLGCCIHVEKILIYEYMPNKSLDCFIFDQTRSKLLDWPKRFQIINGISRGLLYLHQDSRLRIIHRDLKTSNILLDHELNPKISDFGMARSFGGNETEANTTRVVGTYGYMSPEYAIDGLFSVKSDVFSFGVLVLEIVSGKKNRGFHHQKHGLNLLGHAWTLYNEGRSYELIDAVIRNSYNQPEVLRSIHVGLLCVQQRPEDRPNMSTVVMMLGSEIALPQPKQPGFFSERNLLEAESSLSKHDSCTANEITITLLDAR